jgi:hypothetical protein
MSNQAAKPVPRGRIVRTLLIALSVSIVAMIVASIVIEQIAVHIPADPIAKLVDFINMNHNSPIVYTTDYYHQLEPQAELLDAYVATPLTMLVAGIVLGVFAKRGSVPRRVAAITGAIAGAVLCGLVMSAPWFLDPIAARMQGGTVTQSYAFSPTLASVVEALTEIALAALAYGLGAWLFSRPAMTADSGGSGGAGSDRAAVTSAKTA